MTTRADLEREREALIEMRDSHQVAAIAFLGASLWSGDYSHERDQVRARQRRDVWVRGFDALTASIARLDALLSLSDEQCAYMVFYQANFAVADETQAAECDDEIHGLRPSQTAAAHRTVADLVRRTS